eukprot:g73851.t1
MARSMRVLFRANYKENPEIFHFLHAERQGDYRTMRVLQWGGLEVPGHYTYKKKNTVALHRSVLLLQKTPPLTALFFCRLDSGGVVTAMYPGIRSRQASRLAKDVNRHLDSSSTATAMYPASKDVKLWRLHQDGAASDFDIKAVHDQSAANTALSQIEPEKCSFFKPTIRIFTWYFRLPMGKAVRPCWLLIILMATLVNDLNINLAYVLSPCMRHLMRRMAAINKSELISSVSHESSLRAQKK